MTDINGKPITLGSTLTDKWGTSGTVVESNGRTHWLTADGSFYLCEAVIEAWGLKHTTQEKRETK